MRYVDSLGVLKVNNLNGVGEFAGLERSAAAWDAPLEPVKAKLGGEADQHKLKSTRKHGYVQTGLNSRWSGKDGHYHVLRLAS